jgi:hypothetical protein
MTAGVFDIVDVRAARGAPLDEIANDPSLKGTWKTGAKLGVKMAAIADGASRTILVSEILGRPGTQDVRGAWTLGGMGGMAFTTSRGPNTDADDLLASCEPSPPPAPMAPPPPPYQFGCSKETDPLLGATMAAARSAHVGGVVISMVDGSTHFVDDSIDPTVWKNLGTRKGGISADLPAD